MPDTWGWTYLTTSHGSPMSQEYQNTANKSLGFLRRNLKAKNTQLRERAYKAIVHPQLEYAAPVWDPHHQDDILKIEMVQRRAARWVLGDYSPYSSVTDMLGKPGWRTLKQRRSDFRLVLFYKIVIGYVAVPLPTYVIPLTRTSELPIHLLTGSSVLGLIIINTHSIHLQLFSEITFQSLLPP